MKNGIDQLSAIDPNPALRVKEDGAVLYSNKAGELLLNEWGVRVGEKSKCDSPKSTNFVLSMSDNGVGIPEDIDLETPDSL
jgi:hypothetical protein